MKLTFLAGLALGAVLTLLAMLVYALATFTIEFNQADDSDHLRARLGFLEGTAGRGCLKEEALRAEAAERGWPIKDVEAERLDQGQKEKGAIRAIEVDIDPPVAFSKGWGTLFGIDREGCLAF